MELVSAKKGLEPPSSLICGDSVENPECQEAMEVTFGTKENPEKLEEGEIKLDTTELALRKQAR